MGKCVRKQHLTGTGLQEREHAEENPFLRHDAVDVVLGRIRVERLGDVLAQRFVARVLAVSKLKALPSLAVVGIRVLEEVRNGKWLHVAVAEHALHGELVLREEALELEGLGGLHLVVRG